MGILDWIIVILIAGAVLAAVLSIRKRKAKGGCCGCSGCSAGKTDACKSCTGPDGKK